MAAFGAATILMDTLHQHFLQPTPIFPLRNKTKVTSLYRNLSSLRTSLEQDLGFRVGEGEYDEAIKGLEAEMRDVCVELRFQIEHQLRLFYLGKAMKLRLHSAQKLLPTLNRAIKGIETMDCVLDMVGKHFTLPVSHMPLRIKKRVKSFCTQHQRLLYHKQYYYYGRSEEEQESGDEQGSKNRVQSDDELESKHKEMRNMLYEAESLIRQELRAPSSYLYKYMKQRIQARHRIHQIFTLGNKLTSYINKELLKAKNNAYHQSKNSQNNNTVSPTRLERNKNIAVADSLQQASKSTIKMLGCDDEFNTIRDNLNQRSSKREIFSIVGMGGIGKTTLARKIYEDASFISRFDCQAWVTISQEYNRGQVFQSLLHSLDPAGVYENIDDLAERVYKCLKGRRYLIVIDDIWSTDVWDDLIRCFQDDKNGSRILLTTRLKNVAEYAGSSRNFCHNKCFLGSNESWNLFCNKVLSKRIILSPEFESIAREIVEKCKGLPLAITVAAGLLSNSNQTINEWEHIAKNVCALSLEHSNLQCENIIDLSYTFLPHHLRLCFLSFVCIPKDYEVDEDVIIDFWVSEGFLKVLKSKRLEDVARESLQDLVDRYLVLICKERSSKLSRLYQMHDVLRELALREAQKENLLGFKEDFGMGLRFKRILPINSSRISQPSSIQSRICNYNGITPTSNTTSLIGIGYPNITRSTTFPLNQVHAHFKFLRALSVGEFIDVHNIFLEIVGLVHLRWLNIHCRLNIHYLPLFMLRNLQKLEVYLYSSCEPLDIWGLPQLRNLHVSNVVTLVPPRSVHHNLKSIRSLDYRSCTKELFVRIPNLRTLAVTTDHRINPKCKPPSWFESLGYLYKLEELVVACKHLRQEFKTIHSMGMLSLENFLTNLKKLTLYFTFLKWKDVDVISTLSKLEDLELISGAVEDQRWEPKDGGFRQLKFLKILWCGLQCWEATSDHFPVLEDLVLSHIDIEEIPSDFVDITTLKSIKLVCCSESLISSAECIQKERQEYGDDTFVVDISR